jgi:large-conductance mechanosensitive channel
VVLGKIVGSAVDDVIMPIVGLLTVELILHKNL